MEDDHHIVAQIKEFASEPGDQSLDEIANGFATLNDGQRVGVIQKMKAWIGEEDGSSWRKKSQLMDLTRKMTNVHERLRRVNR